MPPSSNSGESRSRRWTSVALLSLVVLLAPLVAPGIDAYASAAAVTAPSASSDGVWQSAFELPGAASLDVNANGQVNAVSCTSMGNCVAGGNYGAASGTEPLLAVEHDGAWGMAFEAPGASALGGSNPAIGDVDCTAPGDCTAAGSWTNGAGQQDVFVMDETNGSWGDAGEIPGIHMLATSLGAYLGSLSCAAPGDCAVGGEYLDGSGHGQAWVDGETDGVWGDAIEVPGTASLNAGNGAGVNTISCGAPGECSTAGQYLDGSANTQVFVDNDPWNAAIEAPGTGGLNAGGNASIYAISCPAVGDCSAGGYYTTAGLHRRAFVVDETSGTWGDAVDVPGVDALDVDGYGSVDALSCPSAGNCTAGGVFEDATHHLQAFAANQVQGTWQPAVELPAFSSLDVDGGGQVNALSCAAPGTCAVGGSYTDGSGATQAFVDLETDRAWSTAEEAPGTGSINTGGAARILSMSCPSTGTCVGGGLYGVTPFGHHAFLVEFETPVPTIASLGTSAGPLNGGTRVVIRGQHLAGVTRVAFGAKSARIVSSSDATVVVLTPSGGGTVHVQVTTPGGTSTLSARARYTYDVRPTLGHLVPDTGPDGSVVTIHGSGFVAGTHVRFGSRLGTRVRIVSRHVLKVAAPRGSGRVSVRIVTPGGVSAATPTATFLYR